MKYVKVILPLAIKQVPTYVIPDGWEEQLRIGQRVEVQFGKSKRYSGLIYSFTDEHHSLVKPKPLLAILDDHPIIHLAQLDVWEWISQYYCCTLGEVMQAALPSSLKLQSETLIILNGEIRPDEWTFNDVENIIIQSLLYRNELTLAEADSLVKGHTVYPTIMALFRKGVILVKERLKEGVAEKTRTWISFADFIEGSEEAFLEALEIVKKSKHQTKVMLSLYDMSRKGPVERMALQKKARVSVDVLKALLKKELIVFDERPFYEVINNDGHKEEHRLNPAQEQALALTREGLEKNLPVLLNGVTGSGKTHIYIELIKAALEKGQQCLFLLPEIALTSQLIGRLKAVFGDQVLNYHSGLNDRDRASIWEAVRTGHPIILGARSSLFLPYRDLGLIVVDEEHDSSYKQNDPAPRYQARDLAIYMKLQWQADIVLGSATPSLESQWNADQGKYFQVDLLQRHGELKLPDIHLVDLKTSKKDKRLHAHFSEEVIGKVEAVVGAGKQTLIFQNRRGYAPVAQCLTCGWHAECPNCDVSLTYHKVFKNIRCHYCGYREPLPHRCPNCGGVHIDYKGFGTERIEDELKVIFPEYRIERMDYDTAGGKKNRERLLERMESQEVDILIGTQMITKGLDFDNIGLVVVVGADQLLFYPHFRTNERGFQMLQQVSGRAGRKEEGSEVLIQAFDTKHPVLNALIEDAGKVFYENELRERKAFLYPPYYRLIVIEAKHKKPQTAQEGIELLTNRLRAKYGNRVIGPSEPSVARVRGYFIKQVMIKMEKSGTMIKSVKTDLMEYVDEVHKTRGLSGVRFNINVDP